jgi:HD-GYP domain-containing protein (c-di-GMP phosphodiesterase class II)
VARFAVEIANYMKLPEKDIEQLRQACELHDLGKIGIGDSILLKISALTELEWEEVRKHPTIGAQILEPLTFLGGVVDLVRQHHEHYDGTGYPEGRKGADIALGARIIHIADAYEAMRSARSYRKKPLFKDEAVLEIKRNSGTQFDPKIVDVFLRVVDNL